MRPEWRQVVPVFVIAFVLGAAAGSWAQRMRGPRRGLLPPPAAKIVARLSRELALDAGQRGAVLALLEARRPATEALHKETFDKMEVLRRSAQTEIRALLRPDQQAKFDAFSARMEARRRKHWGGPKE